MKNSETLRITTPTEREVVLTRDFDVPRDLVFEALTKPELLKRWYGPRGWTMVVCEIDLKVGGAWRFVSRTADGRNIGQRGVYREIVPPERLVNTESWEDWNPGESLVTVVLTERGGKTTYTSTVQFPSKEVRDAILKSGMQTTAGETYDRLEECLTSL